MLRRSLLAASRSRWLAEHVPRYRFVRAAAGRFIAGDDINAALGVASDLARAGAAALVSQLGEDIANAEEIMRVCDHYRYALDRIAEASLPAHISVKLSHLGLTAVSRSAEISTDPRRREIESDVFAAAIVPDRGPSQSATHREEANGRVSAAATVPDRGASRRSPQREEAASGVDPDVTADDARVAGLLADIAGRAARTGSAVWVDMEGSALTNRTIEIFRSVLRRHRNIGICLQAYLHRTERDLETLAAETTAIRLVKGAYNEPPEIAWQRKEDVDAEFHRLALRLLELHRDTRGGALSQERDRDSRHSNTHGHDGDLVQGGVHGDDPDAGLDPAPLPALGTHDVALVDRILRDARKRGVPTSSFEIQMLDGIRVADRQRLLAMADGPLVRVLISYGTDWFPWFVRRLAERPANLALLARSLVQR